MNNNAIQILRTDNNGLVADKQEEPLLEGQPLYNSQKNYLTIGKINGGQASDIPITVRKLEGWFDDNEKITASKTDINYYTIYPSDEGRNLYIKNNGNHIYIEANKNIQLDAGEYLNLGTNNTEYVRSYANTETRLEVSNAGVIYSYLKLNNSKQAELSAPVKITIDTADLDIGSTSRNATLGLTGTLDVTGATTLSSTLGVTGNTTLGSTLTVTGHTDLDNSVTIDGATQINNTLTTNNLIVKNGDTEGAINLNLVSGTDAGDRALWMSSVFNEQVYHSHPVYSNTAHLKYNANDGGTLTTPKLISQSGLTVNSGGVNVTAGGVNVTAGGVTVNAGGVTVNNGGIVSVTAGGATLNKKLTVESEGADITGTVKVINGNFILSNGSDSVTISRDSNNKINFNSELIVPGITSSDTITATCFDVDSDYRLKKNIMLYDFQSNKSILDLNVYEFDYIKNNQHTIGCLAQDLQEICPEIVSEGKNGYLKINESKLVYLLLEEVKKLNTKINYLLNSN